MGCKGHENTQNRNANIGAEHRAHTEAVNDPSAQQTAEDCACRHGAGHQCLPGDLIFFCHDFQGVVNGSRSKDGKVQNLSELDQVNCRDVLCHGINGFR